MAAAAVVVLHRDHHGDAYDVTWYGATGTGTARPAAAAAARVCGDNTVSCRSAARARTDTCAQLLDYLAARPGTPTPRDSVSVCLVDPNHADNNKCCAAWTDYVDGLLLGFLLGAGAKTWDQCRTSAGLVGGISRDVILAGRCQSVSGQFAHLFHMMSLKAKVVGVPPRRLSCVKYLYRR